LLLVVAEGGEFGGEIKDGAKDGKSDQARRDVRMRRAVDMQIEDECPIKSESTEQSVLDLKMARLEAAS